MTNSFPSLARLAALSVALTLLVPPIAGAQTQASNRSSGATASTVVLTTSAFARLIKQPMADNRLPLVMDTPRADLLHQAIAAEAARSATSNRAVKARRSVGAYSGAWLIFGLGQAFE